VAKHPEGQDDSKRSSNAKQKTQERKEQRRVRDKE